MKTIFLFLFLFIAFKSFSQDWIVLTTPQAGILGRPVISINNGTLNFDPNLPYNRKPEIVEDASAESSTEYASRLRGFTSTLFTGQSVKITNVKAYGVRVRSLGETAINSLREGSKFVSEGVCADSAVVLVAFKKGTQTDIAKIVSTLSSALAPSGATEVISKVLPFLSEAKLQTADSAHYQLVVKNPNVYYKVKVAQLESKGNPCGCNWESKCFLYFVNRDNTTKDFPQTKTLTVDYTGGKSKTIERYPEFCGPDNQKVRYYIKLEQDDKQKLHLLLMGVSMMDQEAPTGELSKILEVPYKDIKGIREWRLERKLIYKFRFAGRLKSVLIAISARQKGIGSDSVDILNWDGPNSNGNYALTYIKYPEFKGTYVNK